MQFRKRERRESLCMYVIQCVCVLPPDRYLICFPASSARRTCWELETRSRDGGLSFESEELSECLVVEHRRLSKRNQQSRNGIETNIGRSSYQQQKVSHSPANSLLILTSLIHCTRLNPKLHSSNSFNYSLFGLNVKV